MFKDALRYCRDVVWPRERLRRAHPEATIASSVIFHGDVTRTHLAAGVSVYGPTVLSADDGGGLSGAFLSIGAKTYIGEFNNIRCAGAPISIGRNCLLSQHVSVIGTNHATRADAPVAAQNWIGDGVELGDDVWVGVGTAILPGSRVGDGAVLAAHSVVRGVVEPYTIVGGNPLRALGRRQ